MGNANSKASSASLQTRWLVIALIMLVAFFASYRFAQAQSSSVRVATASSGQTVAAPGQTGPNAQAPTGVAGGGGCCGSGGGGPKVSKQAEVAGGVQKIAVDLSTGSYNPSEIVLKAGVPAEITFGQGGGCLAQVQSQDLGFFEDLTGGAKTVTVPALKAGTYSFTCGMGMVSGSIVVK
jgi:hypothetical protein